MGALETLANLAKEVSAGITDEAPPLALKTADELLAETVALVMLPTGGVITLTEVVDDTPNWSLNFSAMGDSKVLQIVELIARLETEHPVIDWASEGVRSGTDCRTIHFRAH